MYEQASGRHAWYYAASGTAGNTISFTQAMTLDASGRLGIENTSPGSLHPSAYALVIGAGSGNRGLTVYSGTTGTGAIYFADGTSGADAYRGWLEYNHSTDALTFATNGVERARITSGANFLVGQTTQSATAVGFSVNFGQGATIPAVSIAGASSVNTDVNYTLYSTTATAYRFYVGYGGTVYATNTTISAVSDQRLKENIQDLDVGLDKIMALKPRKFDWKEGKGKDIKGDRGFIAQEFEQVFPDLIDEWKDPAPEGEEPYKSVRADLIPVLVKAIQELKAQNDDLRARVAQLEAK